MKLLLIDSRITEKQQFIDARQSDVDYHVFDYFSDTYSTLTSSIVAKGQFTDIALVQHTDMIAGIKILSNEERCNSLDTSPYSSFETLKNFLRGLKFQAGLQRFDFLGCAMYDATVMPTIFQAIESDLQIDLRASTNFTGNAPDGDWVMESDNVDVRDKYFTEAISEYKGVLHPDYGAGAYYLNAMKYDVCGNPVYHHRDICGRPISPLYDASGKNIQFPAGTVEIFAERGSAISGTNNVCLQPGYQGCVALKSNGSVSPGPASNNTNFVKVVAGLWDTYSGIRADGTVASWGDSTFAGTPPTLSGFTQIAATNNYFAGLHSSGTIYTWGSGAPSFPAAPSGQYYVAIYTHNTAITALTNLGRIMGIGTNGGESPNSTTGYRYITAAPDGFCALHSNGSLTVWGHPGSDSPKTNKPTTSDFVEVINGGNSYAGMKANGTIVLWGDLTTQTSISGYVTFAMIAKEKICLAIHRNGYISIIQNSGITNTTETDFVSVFTSVYGAVALRSNGALKVFGKINQDSTNMTNYTIPSTTGHVYVQFIDGAFWALKNDGSITLVHDSNRTPIQSRVAPTGQNFIMITQHKFGFTGLRSATNVNVSDYYYSTGASKIISPPPPPPSGADAVTSAVAGATVNQAAITDFVSATTKTPTQIYKELKEAIKTSNLYNTSQYNDTITAVISSLRTKTGASSIDISFSDISNTFKTSLFPGNFNLPVKIILPDFTAATPSATIPSNPAGYIKVEAPTATPFNITAGGVTKNFTLTLSGTAYLRDTATNTNYYLGNEIEFGSIKQKIVGFGSVLLEDTTVVADPTLNNVTVYIPMTYELSGADVQLFGQNYTMSGDLIVVNTTIPLSSLYDASAAWLKYKQGSAEDDFTAGNKDAAKSTALKESILSSLHIADGASYDATRQGTNNLDCSAVFVGADSKWYKYHNLQDFVLSYFANNILGHPGALAAISNDYSIRTKVTSEIPIVLNELATMSEDKCKVIVQQIMNQDLARFNLDEKNVYQPVVFRAGDKLILQLALHDNSYSLKSPAGNPTTVVGGVTVAQNASASVESTPVKTTTDYYLLQLTIA